MTALKILWACLHEMWGLNKSYLLIGYIVDRERQAAKKLHLHLTFSPYTVRRSSGYSDRFPAKIQGVPLMILCRIWIRSQNP